MVCRNYKKLRRVDHTTCRTQCVRRCYEKEYKFSQSFHSNDYCILWVSSFNGFVFAGELPTETELDERVVEETQVEDEQIIVSDTETQPATESDPVVESDTILDDNIETSTETESEVETEAEGETDDPTKVEPQSEDKRYCHSRYHE